MKGRLSKSIASFALVAIMASVIVTAAFTSPVHASGPGDSIIQQAEWYENQPNAYSQDSNLRTGTNQNGEYWFDCSGFIYRVFEDEELGNLIQNSSDIKAQYASGQQVAITDLNASPPSGLIPGDLVFFGGTYGNPSSLAHVGIVESIGSTIGATQFISPTTYGSSIQTNQIDWWSESPNAFVLLPFSNSNSSATSSSSSTSSTSTNEAGHVLAATQSTSILDTNGNPITVRCNGPSDGNGNAILPQYWDVVVLDDSKSYQLNGQTYVYVAYPDPCEPGLDFSDNQSIASGSGAVGWVSLSALTETDAAQPNPQDNSGADWQDCWDPTQCGDQPYPNNSDTLSAKDSTLYAWWNGQMWDPHWWHALDNQSNECSLYGRDWNALMVYG